MPLHKGNDFFCITRAANSMIGYLFLCRFARR